MNFQIEITRQAENDLRNIYEYIAFELLSADYASGQLDRLEASIMKLEHFPDRYKMYEKEPWRSRGLRTMPVDNFLVFYVADSINGKVTVIRIMYKGRDIEEELKGNIIL